MTKITTAHNTDGAWGNKLVTFFARYRDNFIVTLNLSLICQFRAFRLWTNPATGTTISFAGTGKKCAMVSCPPGLILPKVPGHLTADGATNAYYRNRRAVSCKANLPQVLTIPGLLTRAQEIGGPSLQPSPRRQTHVFLPIRTPPAIQFILTHISCQFIRNLPS